MRMGNSLGNRLLALALSIVMVLGMLPAGSVTAEDASGYAAVTPLTQGVTVDSGKTTVKATFGGTLNWVAADENVGRGQDGWWVGIKATAPETVNMEKAQYKQGENVKLFKDYNDSPDDAQEQYIELWGLVKEDYLRAAGQTDGLSTYTWYFDWDGDNTYEQTVILDIVAEQTVLIKDNAQVYPAAPLITGVPEGITPGGAFSGDENGDVALYSGLTLQWVAADASVGRMQDGWWVGIKMPAPEVLTKEEQYTHVTYQRLDGDEWSVAKSFWNAQDSDKNNPDTARYLTLWGAVTPAFIKADDDGALTYQWRFDWNGDGLYEQPVMLKIETAQLTLLDENGDVVHPLIGEVKGLTNGANVFVNEDGVNVVSYDQVTLQWSAADPNVGRNQDGWWVGAQITAPASITEENETKLVKYQRLEGTEWSEGKSFWNAQDSDKNNANTARYLTVWGVVTPKYIEDDNDGVLTYKYRFDWDGDGIYEQTVSMEVKASEVLLMKGTSQMYPVLKGTVDSLSGGQVEQGEEATVTVSNVTLAKSPEDLSIGRQEGWYVGAKITAPAGMTTEEDFANVKYRRKTSDGWYTGSFWNAQDSNKANPDTERYLTMWGLLTPELIAKDEDGVLTYVWQFDWNADGEFEQTLTLNAETANVVLMDGSEQVYPVYFGKVVSITGGEVSGDATAETVISITEGTLQWSEENTNIGRKAGWYVGAKITAPEHMTIKADFDKVTYQTLGSNGWSGAKNFWNAQDSNMNIEDAERYLTVWGLLTPENIAADEDGTLVYQWRFDWNGDGVYEQLLSMEVKPEGMTLLKDGVQHYPVLGHVSTYTGGTVTGSGTSEVTVEVTEATLNWTTVGTTRGWWVGILVNAPESTGVDMLKSAKYRAKYAHESEETWTESLFWNAKDSEDGADHHYIQMWFPISPDTLKRFQERQMDITRVYEFDWNGDGNWDQTVTFSVAYDGVYNLLKADQTAFQILGEKDSENNEITEIVYNRNGNKYVLTAEGVWGAGVKYTVDDETVATVDENGVLTILKAGTVTVTATSLGDDYYHEESDTFTLTITHAPQQIVLDKAEDSVFYGTETYEIGASVEEPNSKQEGCELKFEIVSDEVGATVDANGVITFNYKTAKVGKVVVKVTKPGDACYSQDEETFTLTVNYLTTEAVASHSGTKADPNSVWYIDDVMITAPAGFTIHTDNGFESDAWSDSFSYTVEGADQTVAYYLKNADGHMTDKMEITGLYLDSTKPEVSITYSKDVWGRLAETLSFGFYEAEVIVTVTADDAVSGLKHITLGVEGKEPQTILVENMSEVDGKYVYEFTLPAPYDAVVSCTATDVAGIVSNPATGSQVNLVVDNTNPAITVVYDNILNDAKDPILYAQKDVTAKITIEDANFDLSLIQVDELEAAPPVVTVNGVPVANLNWVQCRDEAGEAIEGKYEVEFLVTNGDGDYTLAVSYADRSQNEVTYTKVIHTDSQVPVISFQNDTLGNTCTNKVFSTEITVQDHNFDSNATVVKISAVDKNGKVTVEEAVVNVDWVQSEENKDIWTAKVSNIAGSGIYKLTVESKDLANNNSSNESAAFIVETDKPENITISYSEEVAVFDRVLNALTFGSYKIYQDKVVVTIRATDLISGVKLVEWTYTRDDGVSVTNTASLNGSIEEIVYTDANGTEAEVSFTLDAKEVEHFRGSVSVIVTDFAGNSETASDLEKVGVIVDPLAPTIVVTHSDADRVVNTTNNTDIADYDFSSNLQTAKLYYSGAVTSTIQITEANFDLKMDPAIKDGENVLANTGWEQLKNEAGELTDTWQTTVTLTDEGEHQITVAYKDPAANEMVSYASEIIVIDLTDPVTKIEFSGADVINTIDGINYYADSVTATVTIQETNFRAEDVKLLRTYKDVNGTDITGVAETRTDWETNGDLHTIVLTFPGNANYTLDVEYTDLATRNANDVAVEAFTVDKQAPDLPKVTYSQSLSNAIISNVTFGYYNGKVTVTVSVEDPTAGIDSFSYEYLLNKGVSGVNKSGSGTVAATRNGTTFTARFEVPAEALTRNNQFNGYIVFSATDRSGNPIEFTDKENSLVVDNIAPNVEITYNNPVKTIGEQSYYAGDIHATIHVQEANFFSKDVQVSVKKDGQTYPVNVNWVTNYVGSYTGTFTLSEDGDYVVDVRYTDRSNNSMNPYTSGTLTLDTVAPVISVTNVVNNSANTDKVYTFKVTADDINLDDATFAPVLSAVVQQEDGTFKTVNVPMGAVETVEAGKTYAVNVENLDADAIYTLSAKVSDHSGNNVNKVLLEDGKTYDKVRFSINRNGSTFSLDDNTMALVEGYYTQNVLNDLVVFEVNVDELEERTITLNGMELIEGVDYTVTPEGGEDAWMQYTYTISKDLLTEEGEYKLVISSKDEAGNDAFSDVKGAEVDFVVDRTAPVVSVTGMMPNGRYQVETQTVTLVPMDDGGQLNTLVVTMVDENGNVLKEMINLSGDALFDALENNDGQLTFQIETGLYQNVRVVCTDCATDANGVTNTYDETVENISVSSSGFMIFWAYKPARYGAIAGVLAVVAAIVLILAKRKKNKK